MHCPHCGADETRPSNSEATFQVVAAIGGLLVAYGIYELLKDANGVFWAIGLSLVPWAVCMHRILRLDEETCNACGKRFFYRR